MLIASTISIINIIINNIINVNCNIFETKLTDLKCSSYKDIIVAIARRSIFSNFGFSVFIIFVAFENF